MRKKLILRIGIDCVVGYAAVAVIGGVFLAEVTLHPGRLPLPAGAGAQAREMATRLDAGLADVSIAASDGVTLRAWSMRPRRGNGSAAIVLHGLSDNRLGTTSYAELLLRHGFSVLMPDARAHGTSGGELATYGLLEAGDIYQWLDWLVRNEHPSCIFGLGESMGAAQLLQSLRTEARFCAVAAESSFASFREIGYDRVGQRFGTGPWLGRTVLRPVVEVAFAYAKWTYKLDFEQLSPEEALAATRIPILLIHGQSDSNIPVRHSRRIAARNPGVELWEVPDADHCGAISTAPEEFAQKLTHWFDSHPNVPKALAVKTGN